LRRGVLLVDMDDFPVLPGRDKQQLTHPQVHSDAARYEKQAEHQQQDGRLAGDRLGAPEEAYAQRIEHGRIMPVAPQRGTRTGGCGFAVAANRRSHPVTIGQDHGAEDEAHQRTSLGVDHVPKGLGLPHLFQDDAGCGNRY